jgi:nucleotide-binding universal stress UspA family protein
MNKPKLSTIMVPFRGTPADEQALRLACQTARQDKAKILAVHVIEVQRTLPLEAENAAQTERAEIALGQTDQIAHEMGYEIDTELLQARLAGAALVNEAIQHGVDLIVLGIPYRSPLGDFGLGATASYILQNAPCQVWLCRSAAGKQDAIDLKQSNARIV